MVTNDIQTLSLRSLLLAGAAAVAVSSWSVPAMAQDDDDDEETFVITGSRIARSDVTSENPVTIVSGDELRSTGLANLGESLRQTLASGSAGFNQSSVLSGGGATSVDLRNLGTSRVLILVNGRRVASFADSLANTAGDLSLIPIAAVDRVEILRDGASAVYGADAVSGVINVILRDDFEGLTIQTVMGMSGRGDGEQTSISGVMGGNFERGNIIASLEYRFQDEVPQSERPWAFPAISSLGSSYNNGSFFSPGGWYSGSGGTACTIPERLGGDETTLYGGTWGGSWADIYTYCPSFQSAPAGNGRQSPTRYDYAFGQNIFNGSQIFGATFYGTYDINDSITAFMEFQGNARESDSRLDGNPGYFSVPASNPYVQNTPFGDLGAGYQFIRPSTTVGPRNSDINAQILRTVAGFYGDDLFGRFSWEVSYLWTRLNSTVKTTGVYNPLRLTQISSPALCAPGAGVTGSLCDAALVLAGKGSSTTTTLDDALDPLRPGTWHPAEIAYFSQTALSQSIFETENWYAGLSGDIVDLPAGPLAFAVGAERREEQGFNKPDSVTEAGESIANQVFTTQGSYDTTEVFGELSIPVLAGMQWAEELTLSLQGRWFDYSNFGDDTVWKVGADYQVTPDIRFRFSQGTAFRAPLITQLFGGGVTSFDFYNDPCQVGQPGDPGSPNHDPDVTANCMADGINPSTYVQFAGQTKVLAGGNPNLTPETADTMTVGAVLTPGFLPNFSATVDWWQIEIENLITRPTTNSLVQACYTQAAGAAAGDQGTCALFSRNPATGQPLGLVNQLSNSANAIRTDGIDWSLSYFWDQLGGVFTFSHEGTYIFENTFAPGQGGASDRGSIPQFKANAGLSFERNNWSVSWRTRVIGDMDDPRFSGTDNVFNYDGPEAHIEHDLRARYQYNNYGFLVGVNNVFDDEPPYVFGTGNNSDLFSYNAMGRYYFARITADF